MTFCCKLIALAAGLPGLAAAADPEMMNLIMPEATWVVEVNVAKIMASPIGLAIGEAVHQGVSTQLKGELAKANPEYGEQIAVLGNIDWSREVQDIVAAGGTGKSSPALMVVRSALDAARLQAIPGFSGALTQYEGVPILASDKPGNGVIAFLGNSLVAIGPMADVRSAIDRRGQHTVLPAALAAQMRKYSGDDMWVASTGILARPAPGPLASKSPMGAKMADFIEKVAGINGGLRFGPDFDFSVDLEARTEKGASELAQGMSFVTSMAQSQAKNAGKGSGLEGLKFQVAGKHILLSLHVPEEQVRAGLKQMRAAQAAQTAAGARRAPKGGQPSPPRGTISVQSSEGTVLIPVEKEP